MDSDNDDDVWNSKYRSSSRSKPQNSSSYYKQQSFSNGLPNIDEVDDSQSFFNRFLHPAAVDVPQPSTSHSPKRFTKRPSSSSSSSRPTSRQDVRVRTINGESSDIMILSETAEISGKVSRKRPLSPESSSDSDCDLISVCRKFAASDSNNASKQPDSDVEILPQESVVTNGMTSLARRLEMRRMAPQKESCKTDTQESVVTNGVASLARRQEKRRKSPKKMSFRSEGLQGSQDSSGLQIHVSDIPEHRHSIFPAGSSYKTTTISPATMRSSYAKSRPDRVVRLEDIMLTIPDQAPWQISHYDIMRSRGCYLQSKDNRARPNLCTRCGENFTYGHSCANEYCSICHALDHKKHQCPFKSTVSSLDCDRCGAVGHTEIICSEIWRQYHNTVTAQGDLKRITAIEKQAFCPNCAGSGHFSHECRRRPHDKHSSSIASPFINLYEIPPKRHTHLTQKNPGDEFYNLVTNTISEEDSELMSATFEHKQAALKKKQRSASRSGSRNKKQKKPKRHKVLGV